MILFYVCLAAYKYLFHPKYPGRPHSTAGKARQENLGPSGYTAPVWKPDPVAILPRQGVRT